MAVVEADEEDSAQQKENIHDANRNMDGDNSTNSYCDTKSVVVDSPRGSSSKEECDGGLGRRSNSASFLSAVPTKTSSRRGSCISLILPEGESTAEEGGVADSKDGVNKSVLVMKRDSLSKVPRVRPKIIPADGEPDLKAILRRTSLNHVKPNFLHSTLVKRCSELRVGVFSMFIGDSLLLESYHSTYDCIYKL